MSQQLPKQTQPGWFSFCIHRKTTAASRSAELRDIFLSARPPLLPRSRHGVEFSSDLCEKVWFSNSRPQLRGGCATNEMSPFLSGADGVVLVNKFGCAARGFDQHHPGGAEYLRWRYIFYFGSAAPPRLSS